MGNDKNPYRLDKTAFQAMTAEEADNYQSDYKNYSVYERLKISLYLTSIAYDFDFNHPPKIDKTVFSKEKFS